MSTLRDISELLARIEAPGAFAARRTTSADDLHLEVKGVGRIRWPISRTTARRVCAAGRPARFGLKEQTRFDPRVRDTFEIPKTRVRIDERRWRNTFLPMLDRVRRDLGLPDGTHVKAELHNMLVYGPGQFFVSHQDSEKGDDMIGTLVVILPSAFTGGAMVIEHHDEQVSFRAASGKLTFIAFYADCHHQVRPVTAGYRVVLTYNLMVDGDMPRTIGSAAPRHLDALAQSVERFFETPLPRRWAHEPRREPPDRLVYLLDHQYTRRSLAWNRLKNGDAVRAEVLREVARRLDCEIVLALADVHESWSCEDEGFGYGRYGRSSRWEYDEDAEQDFNGSETPALVELLDSDIELRHWRGSGERLEAIAGAVERDEVCYTKPSVELEPFASEHEGYMGNWGNTVDRWYHRAAVVLWPRARTFVIRAKASPRWAIGELTTALKARDIEKARGMATDLVPFWSRVAPGEERRDFLARTLAVAGGLESPAVAASLLEPFTLERLTPSAASRLVPLAGGYGLEWCVTILESWTSEKRQGRGEPDTAWLTSLPNVCRALCDGGSAHGLELARWLVAKQWARVVAHLRGLREQPNPKVALEAVSRMSKPILGLFESSRISSNPELHVEMARFLTSPETDYPIRGLIHLLRTEHETRPRAALPGLSLATVYAHCTQTLTTRLAMPVREKDDWSISAPSRCRCRLCGMLAKFLGAREQVRFEWPLAKDGRAHIHQVIDAHDLPVTHVTRRTGRPFTLVLVKTDALFEREAIERNLWRRDLHWLAETAPAFEAQPTGV
jgi:predicted 2-oxoglutarate/Fe(II)-dependent dioxygenase YbiX